MKNLFKHASSSWVRYDRYEWKKDKNNKYYITPAPDAMPQIYDLLKDYKPMVLDGFQVVFNCCVIHYRGVCCLIGCDDCTAIDDSNH